MNAKARQGKNYTSGFAGEAISRKNAAKFAKAIARTPAEVADLTKSIQDICDDYRVGTARVAPLPAEQRASLREARTKAGDLYRLLTSLDWACREKLQSAYTRGLIMSKDAKRPSPNSDFETVRRIERLLDEAAGHERLPTRQDETLDLRTLVLKLALLWEQYTGTEFKLGRQRANDWGLAAPGTAAGLWIKGIVAAVRENMPGEPAEADSGPEDFWSTVDGALAAALRQIRRRRTNRAND